VSWAAARRGAAHALFSAGGESRGEGPGRPRPAGGGPAAAPLSPPSTLGRCPPYPPDDPAIAWDDERPEPGALRRWLLGDRLPRPLKRRELLVLGIDLESNPFLGPIRRSIEAQKSRLTVPGNLLLNEFSNLDFGWPLVGRYNEW